MSAPRSDGRRAISRKPPAAAKAVPAPAAAAPSFEAAPTATINITRPTGSLSVSVVTEGILYLDGVAVGEMPAGATAKLDSVAVGERSLELRYPDGRTEKKSITVTEGKPANVPFTNGKVAPPKDNIPMDQFDFFTEFKGHRYYLSKHMASWSEANKICQQFGGHLVTITSEKENAELVQEILKRKLYIDIWIGLFNDRGRAGSWEWVTGEKSSYTNWTWNQPDYNKNNITNAQISRKAKLQWDDVLRSSSAFFILEKE
jgi:hypothetical protein